MIAESSRHVECSALDFTLGGRPELAQHQRTSLEQPAEEGVGPAQVALSTSRSILSDARSSTCPMAAAVEWPHQWTLAYPRPR